MKSTVKELALNYKELVKKEINANNYKIKLLALLSNDNPAALTYSKYTADACEYAGIDFKLKQAKPEELTELIKSANQNNEVHGILVYYPIFDKEKDKQIKELVEFKKDVEGLNQYWFDKLYNNDRFYGKNNDKKAILPCTSLAILKVLQKALKQKTFDNKTVTIFNRSEVVGAPLAYMIANDGGKVYSFDLNDTLEITRGNKVVSKITRAQALEQSDIVVSGVPSKKFKAISTEEIKKECICLNFAEIKNFEQEVESYVQTYISKIGAVTVSMLLRNTLRLYANRDL